MGNISPKQSKVEDEGPTRVSPKEEKDVVEVMIPNFAPMPDRTNDRFEATSDKAVEGLEDQDGISQEAIFEKNFRTAGDFLATNPS